MLDETRAALRRVPTRAKAVATFDAILEATAALLVERGYEGVNTNVVAERAGLKPPAIYRYFPHKFALYRALTDKLQAELDAEIAAAVARRVALGGETAGGLIDEAVDAVHAFLERRPAYARLWHGDWSISGDENFAVAYGDQGAARVRAAGPFLAHLGPEREMAVIHTGVQMTIGLVSMARFQTDAGRPELGARLVAEAKTALRAYLLPLLRDGAGRPVATT